MASRTLVGLSDVSLRIQLYGALISARHREFPDLALELMAGLYPHTSVSCLLGGAESQLVRSIAEEISGEPGDVARWLVLRGLAETLASCDAQTRHAVVNRAAGLLGAEGDEDA